MRDIKFRAFNGDRIVKVNTIWWIDGEIDWVDTSKNDDFDGGRMKEIRLRKDKTIKEYANQLGIGHERLSGIESGKTKPFNWKEYLKFKQFYKDELLKESAIKKKNAKYTTKEFITFKNVGGRWEMGKLVKQEVV